MTPTLARLYGSQPDIHSLTVNGLVTCETKPGLLRIVDPGVEMVLWRRALPAKLKAWIENLPTACLSDTRLLVSPLDLRCALVPILKADGIASHAMRDWLVGDIESLVRCFAAITERTLVDVRLERVDHDACWKFHRDAVPARLITTYRGPSTQWVLPCHADQALAEQRAYVGQLERVPEHAVAVFKGSQSADGMGIVHRSPPIDGTGTTRWVLCLNEPSSASPDPWEP